MRPILHFPFSPVEIIVELAAIAGVLFAILNLLKSWSCIPDRVPIHFGFDGKPDNWGSKRTLIMLPIVAVVFYLGLTLVGRY